MRWLRWRCRRRPQTDGRQGVDRTTRSKGSTDSEPRTLPDLMDQKWSPYGSFFWAGSKNLWAEPNHAHRDWYHSTRKRRPAGSHSPNLRSDDIAAAQQHHSLPPSCADAPNNRIREKNKYRNGTSAPAATAGGEPQGPGSKAPGRTPHGDGEDEENGRRTRSGETLTPSSAPPGNQP